MSESQKTIRCAAYGLASVACAFAGWQATKALPACWSVLGMLLFIPAAVFGGRCLRVSES